MSSRIAISAAHEFEFELSASVSPGEPEVRHDKNGEGHPGSGPEVEDVRLVLAPKQALAIRMLLGGFFSAGKTDDASVEDLMLEVFRVFDGDFGEGKDVEEKFLVAASEEPDPDDRSDFE